jgi:energy-coupling factor transporter ATP-binding protein EcfA2
VTPSAAAQGQDPAPKRAKQPKQPKQPKPSGPGRHSAATRPAPAAPAAAPGPGPAGPGAATPATGATPAARPGPAASPAGDETATAPGGEPQARGDAPAADAAQPGGPAAAADAGRGPGAAAPATPEPPSAPAEIEPHVRVDARHIESAILALRKPIVAASLPLAAPGVELARAERVKLLSQIDDYLLPRLRESGSPILVALVGSTGAGKSTLVNSIVGSQVSMTGIRRPTTNSPVLACHPDDAGWFAENVFLPTVPRVRQEGLARSGRDGLLVLAASEGMPKGIALLDTPDIDSVVSAHREFAHQFLDASDLWLFMTTSSRYADATVWELLQHARDRGAALGLVLSRIPSSAGPEVAEHFDAMLAANGLGGNQRFQIPETVLIDGKLPREVSAPVREWLEETAVATDRRVAVLTQTMSGVLDTFLTRVPDLAAHIEAQGVLGADLTGAATGTFRAALEECDRALSDGSLMRGEVLARWQDFAGTGDLLKTLQSRRSGKQRRQRGPARALALKTALRSAIESLIISVADRAAEDTVTRWRNHPAGVALLEPSEPDAGTSSWSSSQFAAEAGLIFGLDIASGKGGDGEPRDLAAALGRASPDLPAHAARAVSAWQDQVTRLVRAENVTKRSIARAVSLDDDSLAIVLMTGLLGSGEDAGGTAAIPQRLLTSLFGAGPLRDVMTRARAELRERIGLIFDEEMLRFAATVAAVGTPDAAVALQLYQATYALEVAR